MGKQSLNNVSADEVIIAVKQQKSEKSFINYAEFGVDIGATTLEIAQYLDAGDSIYIFDFLEVVNELAEKLQKITKAKIVVLGNTTKKYDYYGWNLAKLILESENPIQKGIFDVIYIDGAHTFIHDSSTCCLCKMLLRDGGYIIFDDLYWTIKDSPTVNIEKKPELLEDFTEEQIETSQVKMVVDLFMSSDSSFKQVVLNSVDCPNRAIFRKISRDSDSLAEESVDNSELSLKLLYNEQILKVKDKKIKKFNDYYKILDNWLTIKEQQRGLGIFFTKNNIKKVAIYGMGNIGKHLCWELEQNGVNIAYAIDENKMETINNLNIYTPDEPLPEVDIIIITASFAYEEIKNKLSRHIKYPIVSIEEIIESANNCY